MFQLYIQRTDGGFGFTLRHFIVYPPEVRPNLNLIHLVDTFIGTELLIFRLICELIVFFQRPGREKTNLRIGLHYRNHILYLTAAERGIFSIAISATLGVD